MSFPTPTRLPTVPHLKEDGSNWADFTVHFQAIMQVSNCWAHFDGTAMCLAQRDVVNPTNTEREAMKEWAHDDAALRQLLSGRLPDWVLLATHHHKTANALWDVLNEEFGDSGNPNDNNPKGVTLVEQDSTTGEEADTSAPMHLEGAGPEPSMDEEEDQPLEVEEEGIAGKNASVEQDMGPRVELQVPRVSPLAMQEDAGSSPSPSSLSPPTPEAASMQCSPATNTDTSAIPEPDSDDEWETFRAETWSAEDDEALDWARLEVQPVEEGEGWDADEEARAVTTLLVEDAPCTDSMPVPHNALHAPASSHTPAALGAPDEEGVPLRTLSPHGEHAAEWPSATLLE